jgi:hypothetical protein
MFKMLSQNLEIQEFLSFFQAHQWRKAIEQACVIGIRRVKSQKIPVSMSLLEFLVKPVNDLQGVLLSLKQELKHLAGSIKSIERQTIDRQAAGSANIFKERDLKIDVSLNKPGEVKGRHSSCRSLQVDLIGKKVWNPFGKVEDVGKNQKLVKEPKVCNLKEAKNLISVWKKSEEGKNE